MAQRKATLVLLAAVIVLAMGQAQAVCPIPTQPIDLFTGTFTVSEASEALAQISPASDSRCINLTLPIPFAAVPNVAVALTEFESKPSNDLFLSIKPLLTTSTSMIPFQIRTQWKYTCWIKITVMFLAETRNDIEAGYHQRDTGLVGACGDAKVQPVFLPFMSPIGPGRTLAIRVFLNGFEISTQPANGVQSPYEVQLINPTFNQTGILVQLSTTTITQVNTVYISYFVFDATITQLQITSGYLEKFGIQGSTTQAIPPNGITSFKYLLYGLAGFIINQNYQPKICITVDNTLNLNVNGFNSIIAYVNVQFAVFGWNPCGSCLGYPLIYNGQCFSTCPAGTVPVNNGCVQCPINSMPSNGRCVCNQGYYNITGICTSCPAGSYFNGVNCVSCGANAVLTQTGCQCQQGYYNISGICSTCPQGQQWNGATCVNPCASQPGTVWNGQGCVCNQPGTVWNGQSCPVPIPRCGQGAYWNGQQCVCTQPGSFWNGQACQPQNPPTIQCGQNAYWNGQQCVCTQPTDSWNGQACTPNQPYPSPNPPAQCGPSAYWNGVTCLCNIVGYQWTGFNCIMPQPSSCGQNSVWNGTTCVCFVSNYYWNGQGCVPALPPLPPAGPTGPGHRHHHQGSCSAGTFFDQPAQKCLPCTEGCISCTNCTECLNCGPGYSKVGLICKEICGDGLRFTLPCDDGNNIDGDGCSSICKVEAGYTCSGGSPNSKDICTFLRPQRIIMAQTGQTISTGKVSINVRLNWLPSQLTQNSCQKCNNILSVQISQGNPAASITASYIPGTAYTFAVTFDWMNKSSLSQFSATVQINRQLQGLYFSGVDASQVLNIRVDPATLARKASSKFAV